jgi:hypothetical protein
VGRNLERIGAWVLAMLVAGSVGAGCGSGGDPPHLTLDVVLPSPDAAPDLVPTVDLYSPLSDGGGGGADGGCALGTVTNCSSCGDVCLPAADTSSTARVCVSSKCDIECKEEAYDVNGTLSDGCETEDDTPIHDTKSSAQDFGTLSDCDSMQSATASIPSDSRKHQKAPTDRSNGRDDWYKMTITDDFFCAVEAKITVALDNLPTGSKYTAVAYYACSSGTTLSSTTQSAYGGSSISLSPSTTCSTIGDDSGTVYLMVSKVSGSHSSASYTVEITP